MIDNVRLEKYEIHFENSYGIVKDIEKSVYFRLSGSTYQYFLGHYKEPDFAEHLEKKLFDKYPDNTKDKTLLHITYKNKFNALVEWLPAFLFDYGFVWCIILLMLLLGTIIITFDTRTNSYNDVNIIIYIMFLVLNILFHEFGHVLFCLIAGREVKSYGFKLNYGLPMFYVDTSDICMASKKKRILTSLGGIYFNSFLGLLLFVWYVIFKNDIALKLINISYFFVISNILPFVKLDGYYVISDLLEVGNLNKAARRSLVSLLKKPSSRTCKNFFLSCYYIFSIIFIISIGVRIINSLYNWIMT